MSTLQRLRQKVIDRDYYLSAHAEEEMRNDRLAGPDVEIAILRGRIEKRLAHDPREVRYRIKGPTDRGRAIHVVCCLDENQILRILTVYGGRGAACEDSVPLLRVFKSAHRRDLLTCRIEATWRDRAA